MNERRGGVRGVYNLIYILAIDGGTCLHIMNLKGHQELQIEEMENGMGIRMCVMIV